MTLEVEDWRLLGIYFVASGKKFQHDEICFNDFQQIVYLVTKEKSFRTILRSINSSLKLCIRMSPHLQYWD